MKDELRKRWASIVVGAILWIGMSTLFMLIPTETETLTRLTASFGYAWLLIFTFVVTTETNR